MPRKETRDLENTKSPYTCYTCKSLRYKTEMVYRFQVGNVPIQEEYCDGKKIPISTLFTKRGLCCHSDLAPYIELIIKKTQPEYICTMESNKEEKAKFCKQKKPTQKCHKKVDGKACLYLAERSGIGHKYVRIEGVKGRDHNKKPKAKI